MALDTKGSIEERRSVVYEEKVSANEHLHPFLKAGLSSDDAQFMHDISKSEQDKIFHKVDWRLCPMLAVLYLISHLDRYVFVRCEYSTTDIAQGEHR